jgi:hypothetical protein
MSKPKLQFVPLKPSSREVLDAMRSIGAAVVAEAERALNLAAQDKRVQIVSGSDMQHRPVAA